MNWALSCFLAIGAPQAEFLQNLYEQKKAPCSDCMPGPPVLDQPEDKNLRVFISFSVPIESWKDLSAQLERTQGVFILKGLPNHSFEEFAIKMLDLRMAGINAPIDIDPASFERYGIESVPAFTLDDGKQFDRIVGNLRLDAALREMAEKGDTSPTAKELLAMVEGPA